MHIPCAGCQLGPSLLVCLPVCLSEFADAVRAVCKVAFEIKVGIGKHYDVTTLWMKTIPDAVWTFQVFDLEDHCSRKGCKFQGLGTCASSIV